MIKSKPKVAIMIDQVLRDILYSFETIAESDDLEKTETQNPLQFRESHNFESTEAYIEFLNEYCVEIFGNCGPMEDDRDAMKEFNKLLQDERFQITLVGRERGKARSATLFFLSKMVCHADRIHFIECPEDLIHYDVLIAADPYYTEFYFQHYVQDYGFELFKRRQPFNLNGSCTAEFTKVAEILPLLENIAILR